MFIEIMEWLFEIREAIFEICYLQRIVSKCLVEWKISGHLKFGKLFRKIKEQLFDIGEKLFEIMAQWFKIRERLFENGESFCFYMLRFI